MVISYLNWAIFLQIYSYVFSFQVLFNILSIVEECVSQIIVLVNTFQVWRPWNSLCSEILMHICLKSAIQQNRRIYSNFSHAILSLETRQIFIKTNSSEPTDTYSVVAKQYTVLQSFRWMILSKLTTRPNKIVPFINPSFVLSKLSSLYDSRMRFILLFQLALRTFHNTMKYHSTLLLISQNQLLLFKSGLRECFE